MAERDIVIREEDYPSNSHKSKEAKTEEPREKRVKKVTTGKVTKRKKSLGKRIAETFLEDDGKSIGDYILYDVLVPAAKSTLSDVVKSGLDMALYGGDDRRDDRQTYRDKGRTYVSYNRMYEHDDRRERERSRGRNRNRHEFDDIFFESKAEARRVLNDLIDLIEDYDQATVEDFYDLVGITPEYTDARWGWKDLRNAYIENTRNGWVIRFPRTIVID